MLALLSTTLDRSEVEIPVESVRLDFVLSLAARRRSEGVACCVPASSIAADLPQLKQGHADNVVVII